jgi:uncharacterized pyridoxamine 5'-phosphate oxidase family protein
MRTLHLMHERDDDIDALQRLLDDSYRRMGEHMRSIHTPERRVMAADLVRILRGVRVLDLATVNARCEPRVGPVDGLFYRGEFWFGSSQTSVRFRHLRERPSVSGSHTVGESFAVVVHGVAQEVDARKADGGAFLDYLHEIYPDWDEWNPLDNPPAYARIEARRMYAYAFEPAVVQQLLGESGPAGI